MTAHDYMPCCLCAGRGTVVVGKIGEQPERHVCPVCKGHRTIDPLLHASTAKALISMGLAKEAFAGTGGMN